MFQAEQSNDNGKFKNGKLDEKHYCIFRYIFKSAKLFQRERELNFLQSCQCVKANLLGMTFASL